MANNILVRTVLFPQKIYNDVHIILNNRKIRTGQTPWPRKSIYDIVWVHPEEVIGSMYKQDRFPPTYRGRTVGGDWDIGYKQIEESTAFKVLDLRFRKGMEWEDIFQEYCMPHGFLDEKQIRKYREKAPMRDATYRDLKEWGWRVSNKTKKSFMFGDELTVNVTREGHYLRNHSGMHRLVMAQFLGLECIPCLLHVVHEDYVINKTQKNPELSRNIKKKVEDRIEATV